MKISSAHLSSAVASSGGERLRYWHYGAIRSGSLSTPYRYTGQRQAATGLYFYGARWYDPAIGRFIQPDTLVPDPANPQSLNRYAFQRKLQFDRPRYP